MEMVEQLKLSNQLCFPLYAASRKVINLYTPIFKKYGITYTQYVVFMALWEEDRVPVSNLCRRLYLDNGTLTPLLKKMEKDGYISRERSQEDERVVVLCLTEKGRKMQDQLAAVPMQIGACIPLQSGEARTLYELLYKILNVESQPESDEAGN